MAQSDDYSPGIQCKLEPVDGVEEAGRLFVKGPNIMKGYLNKDANDAFQALDGWYDTGDIVHEDDDGYLWIRGRAKRCQGQRRNGQPDRS